MEAIVLNQEIVNKFKKMPTAQLMIKASKATGEEKEIAISLLKSRNQDTTRFETPQPANKNVYESEPEEELTIEEQAMLDEAEKPLKKGKAEKVTKEPKAKKEKVIKEKVVKEKKVREPKVQVENKFPETCIFESGQSVLVELMNKEIHDAEILKLNINNSGVPFYSLKILSSDKIVNRVPAFIKAK